MKREVASQYRQMLPGPTVASLNYLKAMMAIQLLASQVLRLSAAGLQEAEINGVGPGTLTALIADDLTETAGRLVSAVMAAVLVG